MPSELQTSGSDGDLLVGFLRWTREVLTELVSEAQYTPAYVPALYANLGPAWAPTSELLDDLIRGVQELAPSRLAAHGLAGAPLRLKLEVVIYWWTRLRRATKRLRAPMRRLLDALDTLLESIVAALGVGEAVVEMKETIKNALRD